ncbi:hypothetical protein P8935_24090 [Telmatobacter sp. DSM 110680]|uniref:Restriction endonuclease n=1 Tax=Telmatobacter sp. DSM 110680 TaxID=3036704 RepID=A0AAU7DJ22_9BACT
MTQKVDEVLRVLETLSDSEAQEVARYLRKRLLAHPLESKWNTQWELILDAIARSEDISQRGLRGLIAEAAFESRVVASLVGWKQVPVVGERPYDFKLESTTVANLAVTIQVKLQRMEKGIPLLASNSLRCYPDDFFIVEVQKTRNGEDGEGKTRPYRFGEFDILAVSMHPSTADWSKFMYTVGNWLLPRAKAGEEKQIKVLQPVSGVPDDVWTDNLSVCIGWFLGKEKRTVFDVASAQTKYRDLMKELRDKREAEKKILRDRERAEKAEKKAQAKKEGLSKSLSPTLFDGLKE